jgi:GT2 family glycosyltransferase
MAGGGTGVAVVIVNYNAGELLVRAARSALEQTVAPDRVVVVDNGSTDGSLALLREGCPQAEIVELGANTGFAAANNHAIRIVADCGLVALLNPDATAQPGWLEALLRAARAHPDFASFASRLVRAEAPNELDGAGDACHVSGAAWRLHAGEPAATAALEDEEIFGPSAAAALYRRDWLLRAGCFDERYFCYLEDVDLAFRLRLLGGRSLYVADAVVHHVAGAITGRVSDFSVYHAQRNVVWLYVKDMPGGLVWRNLPAHLALNLLALASYARRGRARVVLAAKRDALRGLRAVLRDRRVTQRAAVAGPDELRAFLVREWRPLFEGTKPD